RQDCPFCCHCTIYRTGWSMYLSPHSGDGTLLPPRCCCSATAGYTEQMVAPSTQSLSRPAIRPGEGDSAKRKQILDGARRVFLDLGFDGASMGEIARVAGVSKGTLYVYFADKHHLFEAIVEQENLDYGRESFNFSPDRDPETTLFDFG